MPVRQDTMQVCWSDDGERFAGLGDGGVVATWRLDAPRMAASDTAYLGRSDWCHQVCLSTTIFRVRLKGLGFECFTHNCFA